MGKATQQQSQQNTGTSTTALPEATPEEVDIRKQFESLGSAQQEAIMGLLNKFGAGGASPFALNAQDQAQLDASYKGATDQYNTQATQYADTLAGGRGLRMSDTPVSQQAIQQYGLGMGNLLSAKANQGLNMGLAGNQFTTGLGLAAAQAQPSGLATAYQSLMNNRFAQPTTTQTGNFNSSGSYNQPLMQTILQGTQAASNVAGMFASGSGGTSGFQGMKAMF